MEPANSALTDVLEIAKKSIPEFEWLKLGRIGLIRIEFPEDEIGLRLVVSTRHFLPDGDIPVIVQFDGVRQLQLPELTGGVFSFGELVVKDVRDRQLEGIRFWVKDFLEDLSFYCKTINILSSLPEDCANNRLTNKPDQRVSPHLR